MLMRCVCSDTARECRDLFAHERAIRASTTQQLIRSLTIGPLWNGMILTGSGDARGCFGDRNTDQYAHSLASSTIT